MKKCLGHGYRSGFTMIEIVAVVAILTIIAGAAIPVVSKSVERAAKKATREELEMLAAAALEHVRDTGTLPATAAALGTSSSTPGWSGPYIGSLETDARSGLPAHEVDGWSRPYRFRISGSVLTIDSRGPDGAIGGTDDIAVSADATAVLRELTLSKLSVLNRAVLNYNAVYQSTDPLPGNWSQALSRLVSRGLLPSAAGFQQDAFGSPFVGVPAGASPLVEVGSTNVGLP